MLMWAALELMVSSAELGYLDGQPAVYDYCSAFEGIAMCRSYCGMYMCGDYTEWSVL